LVYYILPTYIIERFNVLELQVNYLRCPYDIQIKISSHVQEKWFNDYYTVYIDYYHNYFYYIRALLSTTIFFPNRSEVGGVRFLAILPEDLIMKV